jgi:hypothetical protein
LPSPPSFRVSKDGIDRNGHAGESEAEVMAHWEPAGAKLDALRLISFRPVRTLFLQAL